MVPLEKLFVCIDIVVYNQPLPFPIVNGVQLNMDDCRALVQQYYSAPRVQPLRNGRKPQRPLQGFFVSDY